jgi:hypothetical protein
VQDDACHKPKGKTRRGEGRQQFLSMFAGGWALEQRRYQIVGFFNPVLHTIWLDKPFTVFEKLHIKIIIGIKIRIFAYPPKFFEN